MKTTMTTIMAYKGFVLTKESGEATKETLALTTAFLKNIKALGFTFDKDLFNKISRMSEVDIASLYKEVVPVLKEMIGADVKYVPMYPNFPDQVLNMSKLELFVNAIVHYLTAGEVSPEYEKDERFPLLDSGKERVLRACTVEDFYIAMNKTLSSPVSLTERDKENILWFFENCDFVPYLPETISFKETAIFTVCCMLNNGCTAEMAAKYIKTSTDILRLAIGFSNGDISLATNSKFKNFKNNEKRLLFELFEKNAKVEEMAIYKNMYIRLGEKIHPGTKEATKKYPKTYETFNKLRNEKVQTFAGKVEVALKDGDVNSVIALLTTKGLASYNPGDFGARLDRLVRITEEKEEVIKAFEKVSEEISIPMLARIMTHFKGRNKSKERAFFPKGDIAKTFLIEDERPAIDEEYTNAIVDVCRRTLVNKLSIKSSLGKVYVGNDLEGFAMPTVLRNVSDSFKTIGRGSRLTMQDDRYITAFIHWQNFFKDGHEERVDIDLSVSFLNDNFQNVDYVSFSSLRTPYAVHSGDFVSGNLHHSKGHSSQGASEFITIDTSLVPEDVRYAVFQIYSFSGQPFSQMSKAIAGFEYRNSKTGEVYEPTLVETKFNLTAETSSSIPFIFDLKEKKFIWADVSLRFNGEVGSRVESKMNAVDASVKSVLVKEPVSLKDIIDINVEARGDLTDFPQEADFVFVKDMSELKDFKLKDNVVIATPFDREILLTDLFNDK